MLARERLIEIGKLITPQWLETQRKACIQKRIWRVTVRTSHRQRP